MNTKGKGKDHENARADLKEMGIRPELYIQEAENGKDLPVAAITMSRKEKKELCEFLHSVKFPSGYCSNFARLVSIKELKLNFSMMMVARLVRLDGVRTLGKKYMNPERKMYDQAHLLVLEYMEVVEPYVLEHK